MFENPVVKRTAIAAAIGASRNPAAIRRPILGA